MFAGRHTPAAVLLLAVVLGVLAAAAGCRPDAQQPLPGEETGLDLRRVPLSPTLRDPLAAGRRSLAAPPPRGPAVDLLRAARRLETNIQRPATRRAALDSVWTAWENAPAAAVWIELATRYRRYAGRPGAFAPFLDRLDSNTAPGAFLRGRLTRNHRARRRWFHRAARDTGRLPPLDRVIVALNTIRADRETTGPDSAAARVLRLLPLARAAAGCYLEGRCWIHLAGYLQQSGRLDDALHAAALAVAMARHGDDRYRELDRRRRLASILVARHDPESALAVLQRALRDAEALDYPWGRKKTLDDAAALCCDLADYRRAVRFDRQALACNLAEADSVNVPRSLVSLAHDYLMLDAVDSAGICLARAARWVAAYPEPRNAAMLPAFQARYRYWIGDVPAADSLLALCRDRLERLGMASRLADVLLDQLRMGVESGRARLAYAAITHLRKLLPALQDRSPNQNRRADLEILSTDFLARQGEFAAAAAALARAEAEVAHRGGEGQRWQLARCRGELALARGDTATARAAFRRCLELAAQEQHAERLTASRLLLGHLLLAAGEGAAVRRLFADSEGDGGPVLGGRRRTRLAARLLVAASYAREGRHREAIARLRRLEKEWPTGSLPDLWARLKLELGRSLAARGRTAAARRALAAAVAAQLACRDRPASPGFRPFREETLREAVESLIFLAATDPSPDDPYRSPAASLQLAERCRWPATVSPAGGDTLSLATVERLLAAPEPLLAFLVGRHHSFAWSGGAGTAPRLHVLPGRAALAERLTPVLADLGRPRRPVDATALRRLAEIVLAPVAAGWPPGTVLHVVPDDILCGVPWPALPLVTAPGDTNRCVLDHGAVVEIPSLADLVRGRGRVAPDTLTLLAVGRDSAGAGLPRLRQAEAEARAVAALWPPARRVLLTGERAAWFPFVEPRLGACGVLHLATHATLHHGGAGRTTLRLGAGPDAVPVTAGEVATLRLHAALVFLSGCETAAPTAGAAAGWNDLARAFLGAGAGAVIAATQRLDDTAARFLAVHFYRHWRNGAGRAAALRRALLELRAARPAWRHPYYWAGYRIMGDGT